MLLYYTTAVATLNKWAAGIRCDPLDVTKSSELVSVNYFCPSNHCAGAIEIKATFTNAAQTAVKRIR